MTIRHRRSDGGHPDGTLLASYSLAEPFPVSGRAPRVGAPPAAPLPRFRAGCPTFPDAGARRRGPAVHPEPQFSDVEPEHVESGPPVRGWLEPGVQQLLG